MGEASVRGETEGFRTFLQQGSDPNRTSSQEEKSIFDCTGVVCSTINGGGVIE